MEANKYDEQIIEEAKRRLYEEGVLDSLMRSYGRPLFLVVSGSHCFGFPSEDSDIDVRGVYIAPTEKFLGLRRRGNGATEEKPFEYHSEDGLLDVSLDEVGHYLRLVSESNGNRVEWPHSRLVVADFEKLGDIKRLVCSAGLSKALYNHYHNFGDDMWNSRTEETGLKRDLYALRAFMTCITLLETGDIVTNIKELNQRFSYDIVDEMIRLKKEQERHPAEGYNRQALEKIIQGLAGRLEKSREKSTLPERPDTRKINKFLINLRIS